MFSDASQMREGQERICDASLTGVLIMVIAYHVIISTYGFWLPNDPRGSGSNEVRAEYLKPFGPPTKVETRQSVADVPHDYRWRKMAKSVLKFPEVSFNDGHINLVGEAFGVQVSKSQFRIHACCIQDQHTHLVVARHHYDIEQVVRVLKQAATGHLQAAGHHPLANHHQPNGRIRSPWAQDCWKVFLFNNEDVLREIRYVENNPLRHGKPIQEWPFVIPFDGYCHIAEA